jgi:hypothetical protein
MFVKICWVITALVTCFSALDYAATMVAAESAPQQAAGAAMAAVQVIVPYVFTRCMEGLAASRAADQAKKSGVFETETA